MKPIADSWCIQLDITNFCHLSCLYCSRYIGHLRPDQRRHMSFEQFQAALESLKGWPKLVGIIGGEPTIHPEFERFCEEAAKHFPPKQLGLWTAGPRQYHEFNDKGLIKKVFGLLAYNEHNPDQEMKCKHQPITVAIREVVPDRKVREALIDDCWVQRTWCATINHYGAYFCEVAAAQDVLLYEGRHAWPVVPGWWQRQPHQYGYQRSFTCGNCGMAIPMERFLLKNKTEKFSPGLLRVFRKKGLRRVDENHVEIFDSTLSKSEIIENARTWKPGNYRSDLHPDDATAPEELGFTKKIE
jgi:hypothetical protein